MGWPGAANPGGSLHLCQPRAYTLVWLSTLGILLAFSGRCTDDKARSWLCVEHFLAAVVVLLVIVVVAQWGPESFPHPIETLPCVHRGLWALDRRQSEDDDLPLA